MTLSLRPLALAGVLALTPAAAVVATACAPPRASSVKLCSNGGARPVYVDPRVSCPAGGWNVKDPLDGGRTVQSFPCGKELTTSQGLPSPAEDDACATWVRKFYLIHSDDGSVTVRTFVVVSKAPLWQHTTVAVEVTGGYAIDGPITLLPPTR